MMVKNSRLDLVVDTLGFAVGIVAVVVVVDVTGGDVHVGDMDTDM